MEMNGVTTGRIVHYILTPDDVALISEARRRDDQKTGNPINPGDHVAMLIVAVFPNEFGGGRHGVNGQCMLDGNHSHWVTSVRQDESKTDAGTWHWIEKV